MHKKVSILGVNVSALDLDSACQIIEGWVAARYKAYVCVAPVSTIVDCQNNSAYKDIVNAADMVTPDGMPLVWLLKAKGCSDAGRVYGPDLMAALCQREGLRHYFFGSTPDVLSRLDQCLKKDTPYINITGMVSPPFRFDVGLEDAKVIAAINEAKPDVLWIGLGSPKQDFWMHRHRGCLDAPVMIGVGAAFDFVSGMKRQAPRWMRQAGLEWLFRFLSEPGRLWKRYLIGNSVFIYYLLKDILRGRV